MTICQTHIETDDLFTPVSYAIGFWLLPAQRGHFTCNPESHSKEIKVTWDLKRWFAEAGDACKKAGFQHFPPFFFMYDIQWLCGKNIILNMLLYYWLVQYSTRNFHAPVLQWLKQRCPIFSGKAGCGCKFLFQPSRSQN